MNNFSEENKFNVELKTETKRYDTREEMKDNAIQTIYVLRKALGVNAKRMKEKLNYALKKADYEKLAPEKENDHVLDLKEQMDKTILKLATLKNSDNLNIEQLRE